ncbi:MAG: hypothetical protein AAF404_11665 [Pseudomonadota bacterium]
MTRCPRAFVVLLSAMIFGCQAQHSVAVVADNNLQVGIQATDNKSAITEPVALRYFINNTTDKKVTLLPWGTPLEAPLTADVFDVTRNGQVLPYIGIMVKRIPPTQADYIDIEAGHSIDAQVLLSDAYDMSAHGDYEVQLKTYRSEYLIGDVSLTIVTTPVTIVRVDR